MRKWRRLVAHNKMKKAGYTRVNKDRGNGSFFLATGANLYKRKKEDIKL